MTPADDGATLQGQSSGEAILAQLEPRQTSIIVGPTPALTSGFAAVGAGLGCQER